MSAITAFYLFDASLSKVRPSGIVRSVAQQDLKHGTLAVLRPEPGNAATVARARAAGFEALSLPLFAVRALAWAVPDPGKHDALILTSANVLRFGGAGLDALRSLPVLAVGPHTANAARVAGFDVMATGRGNGAEIASTATARGISRALYLTGRDHTLAGGRAIAAIVPVYESVAIPVDPTALLALAGTTALLHSARAARRVAELVALPDRAAIAVAAFSRAIASAAGCGWASIALAATPEDAALFAAIRALPETRDRSAGR